MGERELKKCECREGNTGKTKQEESSQSGGKSKVGVRDEQIKEQEVEEGQREGGGVIFAVEMNADTMVRRKKEDVDRGVEGKELEAKGWTEQGRWEERKMIRKCKQAVETVMDTK